MSEERRRELGESDAPLQHDREESFDRTVGQGAERLQRTTGNILATGIFGGPEVGLGTRVDINSERKRPPFQRCPFHPARCCSMCSAGPSS